MPASVIQPGSHTCHDTMLMIYTSVQIQHLQAQVELLEADSAGRHNADSRPGSPRDSGADKLTSHVDSLQADNTRLQHQVSACLLFM